MQLSRCDSAQRSGPHKPANLRGLALHPNGDGSKVSSQMGTLHTARPALVVAGPGQDLIKVWPLPVEQTWWEDGLEEVHNCGDSGCSHLWRLRVVEERRGRSVRGASWLSGRGNGLDSGAIRQTFSIRWVKYCAASTARIRSMTRVEDTRERR